MVRSSVLFLLVIPAFWLPAYQSRNSFPLLKGPYLGQKTPGLTPQLFAPGVISTGMYERDLAVTPDGKEIYYGLTLGRLTTIMQTREAGGAWTKPEIARFASDPVFFYLEPCLTADAKTLFFLSNRPPKGEQPKPGWQHQNIWAANRQEDGTWGEAYELGPPVNTSAAEYFPSVTTDGTLYFARTRPGEARPAIYRARRIGGKFAEPEMLPPEVNGEGNPYNACIAPDESFLVACVTGRQDSVTSGLPNYYVFFRTSDDKWSAAINLGPAINMPGASAISPAISPDGRFFFFASNQGHSFESASGGRLNLTRLLDAHNSPQNGNSDIYWVDAAVIRQLKPKS